jgi:hypothetical protein
VVGRELVVSEGREADVLRIFGLDGIWSELLGKAAGYLSSELIYKSKVERRYWTFDYWTSHREFEFFREKHQAELERFAQWVANEGLLEREVFLGAYYKDEPGPDEGTDIVPA